eukprot:scaffold1300_cov98-Skeletonema_marinoi.AAC.1
MWQNLARTTVSFVILHWESLNLVGGKDRRQGEEVVVIDRQGEGDCQGQDALALVMTIMSQTK